MPTIRLVPSTYSLSNTSLTVSNPANMYTNTDDTTYGTVSTTSTSSRYLYLKGFNFNDIPSGAIINSFSIKFKAYESGCSTSSSYRPYLCNNTTTITGTCSAVSTTATTQTFSGVTADWETISGYGSDFGIRFCVRRSQSGSSTGYYYIYGAEIEVDYTMPISATVTSTLSGNGTISPNGTTSTYEGAEYTLTITPTNTSETVTATKDGVDITSSLVPHYAGGVVSTNLGEYNLESGGFNGSGATYFSGIVGNGYDATQTTSNYYSSSSSSQAVFTYSMAFTDIPSNAIINRVYVMVNGHAESTSNSSEYMCVQLKSGDTDLTGQLNFKDIGTSNSTQTLEATTLPTISQLASMVLEVTLGYYGGAINGATCYVDYSLPGDTPEYYTYTYEVDGDATIVVVIGSAEQQSIIYVKNNNVWQQYSKAYKKINGSWVEQTDLTNLFDTNTNYVKVDS